MKLLKCIFSTLLFLLLACQFGSLQANTSSVVPVYRSLLKNIALDYEGSLLTGIIEVNDGLLFRILDYSRRDDNVMKKWSPGDELDFNGHIKDDVLFLLAKRLGDIQKAEPYLVFDVINTPKKAGLRIVENNEGGKFIKLSDNSVWNFSWYNQFSTKQWKLGERVLVQGGGTDDNAYSFINLDAPVIKNVATATGSFITH